MKTKNQDTKTLNTVYGDNNQYQIVTQNTSNKPENNPNLRNNNSACFNCELFYLNCKLFDYAELLTICPK